MTEFRKVIGEGYDRIEVRGYPDSDALTLSNHSRFEIRLREEELVRDLHYALSRYLIACDERRRR